MNPATQPKGISVTPWNWSRARRISVARSVTLLADDPAAAACWALTPGAGAPQVERLDEEQGRGRASRRTAWCRRPGRSPSPGRTRRGRGRPAGSRGSRRSPCRPGPRSSSNFATRAGAFSKATWWLPPVNDSSESNGRDLGLAVELGREHLAEQAVVDRLPVRGDGDDEVPAAADPLLEGLAPVAGEGGEHLLVVGVDHDDVDRVVPVPAAGQEVVDRLEPGDDDLAGPAARAGRVGLVGVEARAGWGSCRPPPAGPGRGSDNRPATSGSGGLEPSSVADDHVVAARRPDLPSMNRSVAKSGSSEPGRT